MNYFFNGTSDDLEKVISQAVCAALNSDASKPAPSPLRQSDEHNNDITSAPPGDRNPKGTPLASILVAVCCSDCLTDDVKSELHKIEDQQIKIQIEEADKLDESTNIVDLISPHQVTFFPALSENVIAKAASGIFDKPLSRLLLQSIVRGKPIIAIAPEVYSHLRANSPALFRLRQAHRQKLEQFGVRLITQKDISRVLLSALPISTFKGVPQEKHPGNKQLLTAEDIEKAAKEGKSKLVIPYRSIITPLAKDRAKDLNVAIEMKG